MHACTRYLKVKACASTVWFHPPLTPDAVSSRFTRTQRAAVAVQAERGFYCTTAPNHSQPLLTTYNRPQRAAVAEQAERGGPGGAGGQRAGAGQEALQRLHRHGGCGMCISCVLRCVHGSTSVRVPDKKHFNACIGTVGAACVLAVCISCVLRCVHGSTSVRVLDKKHIASARFVFVQYGCVAVCWQCGVQACRCFTNRAPRG